MKAAGACKRRALSAARRACWPLTTLLTRPPWQTPASATESAPERAELITLPEPRRLRRLLDGQRAALAGQAAACLALGGMLHDLLRLKKQRRKRRSGWAQLKKRNTCRALRACPGAAGEKKPAQARTGAGKLQHRVFTGAWPIGGRPGL